MKQQIFRQRSSERLGVKLRWGLIAGSFLLLIDHLSSPLVLCTLFTLVASNVFAEFVLASDRLYERLGRWIFTSLRMLDGVLATVASILPMTRGENMWLLGIPVVLNEGFVSRSWRRPALMATLLIAFQSVAFFSGALTLSVFGMSVWIFGCSVVASTVLTRYHLREELLRLRDRRLETIMQCSSALASSRDLRSMVLHTLRSAVNDLGASCGYVMLVSEEDKQRLQTEAAYSQNGEFEFPEEGCIGEGLSGYVAKMGQLIELHDNGDEPLDYDGIVSDYRSAISVPLTTKSYSVVGQASNDQVIGAMTLLMSSTARQMDSDDLELLQGLGSLIAVGVANCRMEERQRATFLRTLESLATALEARDDYTRGHSQRVCELSLLIGQQLGLGSEALEELRIGTILHDIGKIGVPDAILNKPGRLTDEEFAVMKSHPVIGYEICMPLRLSEGVLMIIRNHHEKLDGSGYPDGLKGGELPLSLRIVCVADAFDAMSSRRPYRGVMDINHVLAELSKGAGVQFDPVVVESLKNLLHSRQLDEMYSAFWNVDASVQEAA